MKIDWKDSVMVDDGYNPSPKYTVEELYQAFKARLIKEVVTSPIKNGSQIQLDSKYVCNLQPLINIEDIENG